MSETGSALPIDELEQDAVLEQTEHAAGMEYDESIFYNFLMRREKEKNNKILVFELKLGSEVAEYKELTLRALLQLIHDEIAMIEIESIEKAKKNRDERYAFEIFSAYWDEIFKIIRLVDMIRLLFFLFNA
jgi:hypothetical protein